MHCYIFLVSCVDLIDLNGKSSRLFEDIDELFIKWTKTLNKKIKRKSLHDFKKHGIRPQTIFF